MKIVAAVSLYVLVRGGVSESESEWPAESSAGGDDPVHGLGPGSDGCHTRMRICLYRILPFPIL